MAQPVHIIAILTPKPGKSARVQELIQTMIQNTYDKESTTSRYHMHLQLAEGDVKEEDAAIIMTETYVYAFPYVSLWLLENWQSFERCRSSHSRVHYVTVWFESRLTIYRLNI